MKRNQHGVSSAALQPSTPTGEQQCVKDASTDIFVNLDWRARVLDALAGRVPSYIGRPAGGPMR